MTEASALLTSRSEFDDFLFASVGEETNGMVLSVISALVRLNVDPWQEAAKLSGLPVDKAVQSLGSLLAKLPEGTFATVDARTMAAGLVAVYRRRKIWSFRRPLPYSA